MRARNLKPSIHKNEGLARLGSDHYKLFTGLWGLADRKGRLEDRPERIEAEIFPFKFQRVNIPKMLDDLATCTEQFILRYQRDGKKFIQISNFLKHQYPHLREAESTIPAPDKHSACTSLDRLNPESPILNPSSLNPVKVAAQAPNPICSASRFQRPTPQEVTAYARTIGYDLDGSRFCDFYESKGWRVGNTPMKSWQAAVRTWRQKDQEGKGNAPNGSTSDPRDTPLARRAIEVQGLRKADFSGPAGTVLDRIRDRQEHEKQAKEPDRPGAKSDGKSVVGV